MKIKPLAVMALLGCVSSALVAGCGSSDSGSSAKVASTVSEACKLADKEGKLNFWRSGDQGDLEKEVAPFEAAHPKIKITFGLYRPNEIVQRLTAEKQAGHTPGADNIEGDLATLAPLGQTGQIRDFDWAGDGVSSDKIVELNGIHGIRVTRTPQGIAYNTDKLKEADVPSTYEELASSKWSKQVLYDPRGTYLQGLSVAWGADKAITWFDKFVKTAKAVPLEGSTASLEAVSAGQYLITTSASVDDAKRKAAAGAPLGFKFLDVVPVNDYNSFLVKGAAHPNAATCFVDWWQGPEASKLKLDVEGKTNDTQPPGVPTTSTLAPTTTPAEFKEAADFVKHVSESSQ
jgi:iron(III) transport system substrate-binding protein